MSETTSDRRGRRGGGRDARRQARATSAATSLPYITRNLEPFDILSEETAEIIENNAETILEEIGIDFRDDSEALTILRDVGCDLQGERVRFPRGLARKLCSTAPSQYTQHARNPARTVEIGGKNTVFAPVYGPPFVRDLNNERRYATMEDFRNFVKIVYMLPALHHSGGTICEPVDLPVTKRHLEMVYAHQRWSDKPYMGSVTSPSRAQDTVDMSKILFGEEFVASNTVISSLINANSPMTWDDTMLGALKVYARNNQAVIISPFILAGAMSPVSVAGTLAQTLAEAMSGIAFTQAVNPGAPVIFGSFASSMSMQTGAPTFGTPEPAKVLLGCAKLARRLGVPFRSGGSLTGSKTADAQAAYESTNTIMPTVMGGVNFVLHAGGWMEGGRVADYAKLLQVHLNGGFCGDTQILREDSIASMQVDRGGVVATNATPYGMGWWIQTELPGVLTDPGAFGAVSFIDVHRGIGGYMAIDEYGDEADSGAPPGFFIGQAIPAIQAAWDAAQ